MASSVLEALDCADEINDIRLSISGYRSIGKFTVLVEGIDDVKVYERFFVKDRVQVCQTHGCAKLVELVRELDGRHLENNFLGIKDADYDVLNRTSNPYPNLFLTDKHDLETMMISEETLESIMKEYLRYEDMMRDRLELDAQALIQEVTERLLPLSYFRWYNDMAGSKLSFGSLKLSTMLKEDATLGYDCCLLFIKRLNPDASSLPTSAILTDFENAHSEHIDIFHLLRGHDVCEMISLLLKSHPYYFAKSNVSPDNIERSLRMAYSGEHFRLTHLYASIIEWFEIRDYHGMMVC